VVGAVGSTRFYVRPDHRSRQRFWVGYCVARGLANRIVLTSSHIDKRKDNNEMTSSSYVPMTAGNANQYDTSNFASWDERQLGQFFRSRGLGAYESVLIRHKITGQLGCWYVEPICWRPAVCIGEIIWRAEL